MPGRFTKAIKHSLTVSEELDELALPGVAHIELIGNTRATVDGCAGVLDYSSEMIRINTGKNIVRFVGSGLSISSMSSEQAIVNGTILSVDFS